MNNPKVKLKELTESLKIMREKREAAIERMKKVQEAAKAEKV